jgi:hypothetical protein
LLKESLGLGDLRKSERTSDGRPKRFAGEKCLTQIGQTNATRDEQWIVRVACGELEWRTHDAPVDTASANMTDGQWHNSGGSDCGICANTSLLSPSSDVDFHLKKV